MMPKTNNVQPDQGISLYPFLSPSQANKYTPREREHFPYIRVQDSIRFPFAARTVVSFLLSKEKTKKIPLDVRREQQEEERIKYLRLTNWACRQGKSRMHGINTN
jgi:hypothetical protein